MNDWLKFVPLGQLVTACASFAVALIALITSVVALRTASMRAGNEREAALIQRYSDIYADLLVEKDDLIVFSQEKYFGSKPAFKHKQQRLARTAVALADYYVQANSTNNATWWIGQLGHSVGPLRDATDVPLERWATEAWTKRKIAEFRTQEGGSR